MKKWFPRGAGLKAALFWLLGPWVWGWGLDHMQLQMSGGGAGGGCPTHFCFPWVSPQTTQPAFLLSAAVTPRGCGGFVFLSLPPGSPDKEASLYPLLLPLVAWKSLPSNGGTGTGPGFLVVTPGTPPLVPRRTGGSWEGRVPHSGEPHLLGHLAMAPGSQDGGLEGVRWAESQA